MTWMEFTLILLIGLGALGLSLIALIVSLSVRTEIEKASLIINQMAKDAQKQIDQTLEEIVKGLGK